MVGDPADRPYSGVFVVCFSALPLRETKKNQNL
jgi:hypothetical protein